MEMTKKTSVGLKKWKHYMQDCTALILLTFACVLIALTYLVTGVNPIEGAGPDKHKIFD